MCAYTPGPCFSADTAGFSVTAGFAVSAGAVATGFSADGAGVAAGGVAGVSAGVAGGVASGVGVGVGAGVAAGASAGRAGSGAPPQPAAANVSTHTKPAIHLVIALSNAER